MSMTHETFEREETVKGSSDRGFGLVFTAVFAVIGLWPLIHAHAPRWWSLAVAAAFLAVSLIRPALLAPLNRLWMRFGLLLHRVVNPIVMGLLFFLVLTPFGLALRLLGKDPLRRGFQAAAATYWIERLPPGPAPDTMKNQF
jgi:predicted membrane metal-binding protein